MSTTILLTILLAFVGGDLGAALRQAADDADRMGDENRTLAEENHALRRKLEGVDARSFHLGPAGRSAPATVHVHAVGLVEIDPHLAVYAWDFGDPAGAFNTLPGFNAAHVYDEPGTYTITLTVTTADKQQTFRQSVEVGEDRRALLFVSGDGDDSHRGFDPRQPLRTLTAALGIAGPNTKILLRRGDVFELPRPVTLAADELVLSDWGDADAADPVIRYTGPADVLQIVEQPKTAAHLRIEDIAFETPYTDVPKHQRPTFAHPAGQNLTLRGCTFDGFDTVLNGDRHPTGVLLEDCAVETETGLAGYFLWGDGSDLVLLNNRVANSTAEHSVRIGGADRLLVYGNTLTNLDRSDIDKNDYDKAALNVQRGRYAWCEDNTITGPLNVGPLGGTDGRSHPEDRFRYAVFKDNTVTGVSFVYHGCQDVLFTGNTLTADGHVFQMDGYDADYQRGVSNVLIENNHATTHGQRGSFLRLFGRVENVTLRDNTYTAPDLVPGGNHTGAVVITGTDLTGLRFTGNRWPDAGRRNGWVKDTLFYVWPTWSDKRGYLTLTQWNALPQVTGDATRN